MTTTPEETPEEHVHKSVGRQAKAAKNVVSTAKRVAKKADDKAEVLAAASDLLSSRVGTLVDAVRTNNEKIDRLQHEINQKPDDTEVQFITGLAKDQRTRHLRYAIITAIIASVLSGTVAFATAQVLSHRGCQVNAQNIDTLISILESTPMLQERYALQITDLKSNRNDC